MARKQMIAAVVGAGILAGGIAAVGVPVVASAQDEPAAPAEGGPRSQPMRDHLDAKVADGTITQEQADALIADAEARRAERHADSEAHGRRGPAGGREQGGMGRGGPGGMPLQSAADAIGISVDDLRTALRDGQSLAAVAEANGVSSDALVDTLTEQARSRITEMVNRVPGD